MVTIGALWLPIVVSAVLVFIASAIAWMVLPHHRSDYQKLPGEAGLLDAIRKQKVAPGQYVFPCIDMKEMSKPDNVKRYQEGPVGFMTVRQPGPPGMTKQLILWFIFLIVVSIFVAYLTGRTVASGAHYLAVFRVAGTTAVLAYAASHIPNGIWQGRPWNTVAKEIADGIVYGLLTAGTFGWLWPR